LGGSTTGTDFCSSQDTSNDPNNINVITIVINDIDDMPELSFTILGSTLITLFGSTLTFFIYNDLLMVDRYHLLNLSQKLHRRSIEILYRLRK
jgi:hypothetical protein